MEKMSLQFRDKPVQSLATRGESKFVQLSFDPGQGLTRHRAPLALTVVVLTGAVRFTVADDEELLRASEMVMLDPNVEHAIEGVEKSTVLLVLTPLAPETETGSKDPAAHHHGEDATSAAIENSGLEHENAYQNPALLEQIAPEIRVLVEDHIEVCKALESVAATTDLPTITSTLRLVGQELSRILLNHLGKEDSHLFPMASRLLTPEEKSAVAADLRGLDTAAARQGGN